MTDLPRSPRTTIEAIMWSVRERGPQALQEPDNIERLSRCDDAAIAEIDALLNPELAAVLNKARDIEPEPDQSADTDAEIKRLAKLSAIEYERQRKPAAEKLRVRVCLARTQLQ